MQFEQLCMYVSLCMRTSSLVAVRIRMFCRRKRPYLQCNRVGTGQGLSRAKVQMRELHIRRWSPALPAAEAVLSSKMWALLGFPHDSRLSEEDSSTT